MPFRRLLFIGICYENYYNSMFNISNLVHVCIVIKIMFQLLYFCAHWPLLCLILLFTTFRIDRILSQYPHPDLEHK